MFWQHDFWSTLPSKASFVPFCARSHIALVLLLGGRIVTAQGGERSSIPHSG
jgi:hypothetical protein